jgi:hypothetical protein
MPSNETEISMAFPRLMRLGAETASDWLGPCGQGARRGRVFRSKLPKMAHFSSKTWGFGGVVFTAKAIGLSSIYTGKCFIYNDLSIHASRVHTPKRGVLAYKGWVAVYRPFVPTAQTLP